MHCAVSFTSVKVVNNKHLDDWMTVDGSAASVQLVLTAHIAHNLQRAGQQVGSGRVRACKVFLLHAWLWHGGCWQVIDLFEH